MQITVLDPTFPEAKEITQDDVWGKWSDDHRTKISDGMVVANHTHGGFDEKKLRSVKRCPIFKDYVDYKSATIVGPKRYAEQIAYWLEYVHGCDCISKVKDLPDDMIAFRSDYMAW